MSAEWCEVDPVVKVVTGEHGVYPIHVIVSVPTDQRKLGHDVIVRSQVAENRVRLTITGPPCPFMVRAHLYDGDDFYPVEPGPSYDPKENVSIFMPLPD